MGMGKNKRKDLELEGMGLKKTFPHTSSGEGPLCSPAPLPLVFLHIPQSPFLPGALPLNPAMGPGERYKLPQRSELEARPINDSDSLRKA